MARRKKKSSNKYAILIMFAIVALITIMAGMFYASSRNDKDVLDKSAAKIGAPPISLLNESVEAQRIVDNILLQKKNWQLIEKERGTQEVKVKESGATVKINKRILAVGVPTTTSLAGAGSWVEDKVRAAGLEYIGGSTATYKGWNSYKIQVGIAAKAGDGKKKFTTDTIFFYYNGNLTDKDKDVLNLPLPPKEEKETKKYSGKLAIIVDDCGYDIKAVRALTKIGLPFSYAILPYKNFSSDALEVIKTSGNVPMLHLPMEPSNRSSMSEGSKTICTDMKEKEIRKLTQNALKSLPGVMGVNNHQGSKATSDKRVMEVVLRELKAQDMFFVDSRTASTSVGRDTAKKMGVKTAKNDIFLDNSKDVEDIRRQVLKAIALAEKNGTAIAICHARPATVKMWEKYADEFRKTGISFVHVTDVLY